MSNSAGVDTAYSRVKNNPRKEAQVLLCFIFQIEAIVRKICQYFDIYNRNVLEEITPTSINQIGRFLQYLR